MSAAAVSPNLYAYRALPPEHVAVLGGLSGSGTAPSATVEQSNIRVIIGRFGNGWFGFGVRVLRAATSDNGRYVYISRYAEPLAGKGLPRGGTASATLALRKGRSIPLAGTRRPVVLLVTRHPVRCRSRTPRPPSSAPQRTPPCAETSGSAPPAGPHPARLAFRGGSAAGSP